MRRAFVLTLYSFLYISTVLLSLELQKNANFDCTKIQKPYNGLSGVECLTSINNLADYHHRRTPLNVSICFAVDKFVDAMKLNYSSCDYDYSNITCGDLIAKIDEVKSM